MTRVELYCDAAGHPEGIIVRDPARADELLLARMAIEHGWRQSILLAERWGVDRVAGSSVWLAWAASYGRRPPRGLNLRRVRYA